MQYKRLVTLSGTSSSAFLFGPRMTGKTSILKLLQPNAYIDLLDRRNEITFRSSPEIFWERLNSLPQNSLVIVDEVQKIPELLDYVQKAIDELGHRFILSGSSARKLKRSGANLLGGRAIEKRLYPLSSIEVGPEFSINNALSYGTLPKIYSLVQQSKVEEAKDILESYYALYIKEEVQAEALTRNLSAFQRFLNIAAQSHGHIIEYSNIAAASKVPDSTIKEYFSILEDTLIGSFLWPWDASERKKARPKFYFFDPGVVRAIQNRLNDPPTGQELGFLFEGWFVGEITRVNHYYRKRLALDIWRGGDNEIYLLVHNADQEGLAIEIKSGDVSDFSKTLLKKFRGRFPKMEIVIASLNDTEPRRLSSGVLVLPWKAVVERVADWGK